MCIRVDANDLGDGAGTHVSVHVYRMQGVNMDHELLQRKYLSITLHVIQSLTRYILVSWRTTQ